MTDQPVPDRSDDLTTHPNLDREGPTLATGTGDPATSDTGAAGQENGEAGHGTAAGDAPKPSPDI